MGDRGEIWPDGCGNGRWCQQCRDEIREEAILWLRELNVVPSKPPGPPPAIHYEPWHKEWLLGTIVVFEEQPTSP